MHCPFINKIFKYLFKKCKICQQYFYPFPFLETTPLYVVYHMQLNVVIKPSRASACHHWEHVTMIYDFDSASEHVWEMTSVNHNPIDKRYTPVSYGYLNGSRLNKP